MTQKKIKPMPAGENDELLNILKNVPESENPMFIKHLSREGLFFRRLKVRMPTGITIEELIKQSEIDNNIRPRPISGSEEYENFYAVPKKDTTSLILTSINLIGPTELILPYIKQSICYKSCSNATSHFWDCECVCLGRHHGEGTNIPKIYTHEKVKTWEINKDVGYAHILVTQKNKDEMIEKI